MTTRGGELPAGAGLFAVIISPPVPLRGQATLPEFIVHGSSKVARMKDGDDIKGPTIEHLNAYISTYVDSVTEEEQKALQGLLRSASYQKGDLIYRQGATPNMVCFLMTGAVRFFYVSEDGKEHTTNFGFENEPVVPYGSFVEQVPSGISVIALEPVQLVWTTRADFNHFMAEHPRFQAGIAKLLVEYLFKGSQQLNLLRTGSSRERYEKLRKMQPEVINRVPLTHIASYLDMALETLSRVRAGKL